MFLEENSGDPFEKENSATVKYLGPGAAGGATEGKTSGSDVSPSGSENHHKTEGSIIKATVSFLNLIEVTRFTFN